MGGVGGVGVKAGAEILATQEALAPRPESQVPVFPFCVQEPKACQDIEKAVTSKPLPLTSPRPRTLMLSMQELPVQFNATGTTAV